MSLLLDALKEAENRTRRPSPPMVPPRAAPAPTTAAAPAPEPAPAADSDPPALTLAEDDAVIDAVLSAPVPAVLPEPEPAPEPLSLSTAPPGPAPTPPPLTRPQVKRDTVPPVTRPAPTLVAAKNRPGLRRTVIVIALLLLAGTAIVFGLFRTPSGPLPALAPPLAPPPESTDVDAETAAVTPADATAVEAPAAGLIDSAAPVWSNRETAPEPEARPASLPRSPLAPTDGETRRTAAAAEIREPPVATPARAGTLVFEGRPSPLTAAHVALRAGDLPRAEALYRETLATEPDQPDARLGLALIAQSRGADAEALAQYRAVLTLRPEDPQAWAGLADLAGEGERDAMESRLRGLLATRPDPALHFALGNLLARQERWADAQESYFAASSAAPQNADYAVNLAVSLDRLGKTRAAAGLYQRALALAGDARAVQFDVTGVRERLLQIESQSP